MKTKLRLLAIASALLVAQAQDVVKIEPGSKWRNKFLNWDIALLSGDVDVKGQRLNLFTVQSVKDGRVALLWVDDTIPTTWLSQAEFLENFKPVTNEIKAPLR